MANDLHNLDDALSELDRLTIKTTQGEFVRMEDVKRLLKERTQKREGEEEADEKKPPPKTFEQAKEAIKGNKELMGTFPEPARKMGRAVGADA